MAEILGAAQMRGIAAGLAKRGGHKFAQGHAVIVSGDHGRAGAARLAARGALRIGAGLVTLASPRGAMAENAARLDAIMLRQIDSIPEFAAVLRDARITALCLGPGMGLGARQAGFVAQALRAERALVLDADALSLIARDAGLFAALHGGCVLTPHGGEFMRLFPDLTGDKTDMCRAAAARAGCVVVFKGEETVIAAPDGRCAVHQAVGLRAAPWLATAGSGDVLAGFISGLSARGWDRFEAACAAVWLHVQCALDLGPGMIAEDLPEVLPKVLREVLVS